MKTLRLPISTAGAVALAAAPLTKEEQRELARKYAPRPAAPVQLPGVDDLAAMALALIRQNQKAMHRAACAA